MKETVLKPTVDSTYGIPPFHSLFFLLYLQKGDNNYTFYPWWKFWLLQGVKIVFSKVAQNVRMMSEASQKMHRNDYNEDKYYIHDNGDKNTLSWLYYHDWMIKVYFIRLSDSQWDYHIWSKKRKMITCSCILILPGILK